MIGILFFPVGIPFPGEVVLYLSIIVYAGETGLIMRFFDKYFCKSTVSVWGKTIGLVALAFGAGILLCTVLPPIMLICIEAAIIIIVGFFLFSY